MLVRSGTMISPTIRLTRELSSTPQASLWVAENIPLGTEALVRLLSPSLAHDVDAVERFMWEAQRQAKIQSPYVLTTFGSGLTPERIPYALMEYAEGEDLAARIARSGALDVEESARVIGQIAGALAAAHGEGLVHHAVASSNVLLTYEGGETFCKLTGFDISGADSQSKRAVLGMSRSVAARMSPEQLLAPTEVDLRADLWGLSVIAYQCVTGKLPFHGHDVATIFMTVDRSEFRPATQENAALPAAMDEFFARAFRHNVDERFATAHELSSAFAAACRGAALPVDQDAETVPLLLRQRVQSVDLPVYDPDKIDGAGRTDRPLWTDTAEDRNSLYESIVRNGERRRSRARLGFILFSMAAAAGIAVAAYRTNPNIRAQADAYAAGASRNTVLACPDYGSLLAPEIASATADEAAAAAAAAASVPLETKVPPRLPNVSMAGPTQEHAAPASRYEPRVRKIMDDQPRKPSSTIDPDNPYESIPTVEDAKPAPKTHWSNGQTKPETSIESE